MKTKTPHKEVTRENMTPEGIQKLHDKIYLRIMDNITDMLFIWETLPEGKLGYILEVNDTAHLTLGYTKEEFFKMTLEQLILPGTPVPVFSPEEADATEGKTITEATLITKDGEILDVDMGITQFTMDENRINIALIRNITDRKRIEEDLTNTNQRYSMILRSVPAVLWTTDTTLKLTEITGSPLLNNKTAEKVELQTTTKTHESNIYDFFWGAAPEDPAIITAHKNALNGTSGTFRVNWQNRTWKAQIEPLRTESGKITGTIGVAVKITDE